MSRLGRLVFWIVLFTNVLICNVIGDNFISIMFWFQSAVFIVMRVRKIGLVGQWYNLELCINKKQQQTYLELIDWFKNYKAILYASFQYFFLEKAFKNVKTCIKFIGRFMIASLHFMTNSSCIFGICMF